MRKILKIVLVVFVAVLISVKGEAKEAIGWYCIRAKNHMQPDLDSTLSVVEDYDVFWIDKEHSSMDDEKVIYLTFDAGYENGNIEKILDVLKEENVKATFFILENLIYKNKPLVQRMIDEGHVIGNHTARHKDMSSVSTKEEFEKELNKLEDIFKEEFGEQMPKLYRPPEGKFSESNLKWATELGYKTVMWSFAYADWDNDRQPTLQNARDKILGNLHNGEVMLLHPTSSTNAEIMKELISELKSQGFEFKTVECDG